MHFICVKDFQTSGEHKWADFFFFDEFDERAYLRYCNIQNINCIPVLWQKLLPLNGYRRVHLKAIYSNGFFLLHLTNIIVFNIYIYIYILING